MNARPGAQELTVETVLELSGVGYGTGSAISIGEESRRISGATGERAYGSGVRRP